jgi:hypothetical protein
MFIKHHMDMVVIICLKGVPKARRAAPNRVILRDA